MVKNIFSHYSPNLRFIPCGGMEEVTKNMFILEFGNDIIIIDCGMGFVDEPGEHEELLFPDFSYAIANQDRIRALLITHAHFDHYGAVPELLRKINVPIYASRLTIEFIKRRLAEENLPIKQLDFHTIDQHKKNLSLGAFQITPFHINHSVPEALGFFIQTPVGNVFHVADFKFDWTPVDEEPFDMQKASSLASLKKPLLLISDCLGANKAGHTRSEATIQEVLENIMLRCQGLVVITTVSTNISRIKQAMKASINCGRKVAFLGRSLEESVKISRSLGYLAGFKKNILPQEIIRRYPLTKLTLIAAGCYGQSDSALKKISEAKHHLVKLKKNDTVIFSADPAPPGVRVGVNRMIDDLSKLGARIFYYDIQDNLHVSGHGTAEDIKMLFALVKAEYLLPIGGDFRHMRSYQLIASDMGYPEEKVLLIKEGQVVEFNNRRQVMVK